MNILSITGILPIKNLVRSNDFLIPLYNSYKLKFPNDNVFFIRLEKYRPFSKLGRALGKLKFYEIEGHTINLMRYISIWRYPRLYCYISSYSAYFINRKKIIRFIKQNKIDILHAEYIIPDGYLAYLISRKCKIPYLVTTHFEFRYFDYTISKRAALKVLNHASFVTPLNYHAMELFKRNHIRNIHILPHGIENQFIRTIPGRIDSDEIRILSIGALISLKNLDKVLIALGNIKEKFSFRYTIVGSGPEKESLVELSRKLKLDDRVSFIERIPYSEIHLEIKKHDIFILPSYFESFGRVLFEAMAVGLPVICAKNTGIHGYFTEGREGFSVDHNSIPDIESKLSLLMQDERLRVEMGKNAKELMTNFTWEKVVDSLQNLYLKTQ